MDWKNTYVPALTAAAVATLVELLNRFTGNPVEWAEVLGVGLTTFLILLGRELQLQKATGALIRKRPLKWFLAQK